MIIFIISLLVVSKCVVNNSINVCRVLYFKCTSKSIIDNVLVSYFGKVPQLLTGSENTLYCVAGSLLVLSDIFE